MLIPRNLPGPTRRPSRAPVAVETLEGRELLSHLAAGVAAKAAHAEVARVSAGGLRQGPILEQTGPGYVVKSPRFSNEYTGTPLSALNASGFKARFDGQGNLVLTGIVTARTVLTNITGDGPGASYVFGINRGAGPVPGPFPGRARLTLDSAVVVSLGPNTIRATFYDLAANTSTPLDPNSILAKQDAVQITVPLSTLGGSTTGITPAGKTSARVTAPGTLTANFFTVNTASVDSADQLNLSNIASFAPENHNITVGGQPTPVLFANARRFRRG